MAYSSLACKFIPAYEGNYTKGRNTNIREICIHYMAGNCSIEGCGGIWQQVGRNGSSNYGIGSDGRIACYVDESNTAWCNSNWDSNCRSVSIETANVDNNDGRITDEALNSLIRLVADIAKRNNMGTLVKGQNVTWHSMYTATSCPGQYLLSKMDYIVEQANNINNNGSYVNPTGYGNQILEDGSKVILNGIFRVDEIRGEDSKYPNGALGCYDLCYGKPIGENDWIPCGDIGKVDGDKGRVDYNAVLKVGDMFMCDKIFEVKKVEAESSHCKNGVAELESDGVRFRIDCEPLFEVRNGR